MLSRVIENIFYCNLDNRDMLRKVIVKIGLEKIDTQKEVIVEALLDNRVMRLVISLEFARKQKFKLKKIERLIYMKNMDGFFNKERPIEHIVEINIYYQWHREKTKINIIGGQKQSIILGMLWFACYNLEIDQRTREVKITRCLEKYVK